MRRPKGSRSFSIESTLFWLSALGLGLAHAFEPDHMAAVSTFVAGRPSPRAAAFFGVQWAIGHSLSLLLFGTALYLLKRAIHQPALFASGALDRVVGLILVALGVWMIVQLRTGLVLPSNWAGWKRLVSRQKLAGRTLEDQIMEQQSAARRVQDEDDELPLFGAPGAHATRAAIPGESARVVSHLVNPKPRDNANAKRGASGNGSLWMGMLHGAAGTGAFVGQAAISLSQSYAVVLAYTTMFSLGVLVAMSFYAGLLGGVLLWGEQRGALWLRRARWVTSLATCAIGICLLLGVELPGLFG